MKIKKIRLYGEKDDFGSFIAEIYMKDKELVIESKDEQLKKDLLSEISKHIENDEFFYIFSPEETELATFECISKHKPGDSQFLEALLSEFWKIIGFGQAGKFGNKKFGGYEIIAHKSEIIEE